MYSIIDEIRALRNGKPFEVDISNSNRYRLVAIEPNGTKTAYYFSVPIYNVESRKLLDLKFVKGKNASLLTGSNANVTIGNTVRMENKNDYCTITMPTGYTHLNDRCISYNGAEIYPTTNGIACKVSLGKGGKFVLRIKTGHPFYRLRYNRKYFALMQEKFRPFLTVSCIGALGDGGEIIASATINYRKINEAEYDIIVSTDAPKVTGILFEVNLNEEKLILDTTVESKNPKSNNAFGGTAFIGNSVAFGEQWLYCRPDFSKLRDVFGDSVKKVALYAPMFNKTNTSLVAYGISNRFCSFGSNWENKKNEKGMFSRSTKINGYQKIDLTNEMVRYQQLLTRSEGWILKNKVKNGGLSVISTGDSFYAPQILEITLQ